ncbi:MAG TPA: GNAT family N-acetyltransferase [Pyrinomonadaceae bacterium]|nr:GNAT family N-acetyltransferase [Pyrinomonadaceae bacterium]
MEPLIDIALARRLEGADARAGEEYAAAHARLFPEAGASVLAVAGGRAVLAGVSSPLTHAVGLGLGPAAEPEEPEEFFRAEAERMEEFFRARGAETASVEFCPLADFTLLGLLVSRGYRLTELTDKLFLPLGTRPPLAAEPDGVSVRVAGEHEGGLWARTVAESFALSGREVTPAFLEIFRATLAVRGGVCFIAEVEGRVAGGGFLRLDGEAAALSGTGVLPHMRGRGVQAALIRARLAHAARAGCDLAAVSALPGSTSHRNLERQGFRVAYTRARLAKSLAED